MEVHQTVTEFFHEVVTDALKTRQVSAAEPTEFYLVNLLAEYTHVANVDQEPLALKLAQSAQAGLDARVKALKEIGDTSLYVSGFFADSLVRRMVDVEYYITMGGSAYGQLSSLIGGTRGTATDFFKSVYAELSEKFARFVDVFQAIRAKTNFASSTNVVALYEQWAKTGSEWLEKRLRASGLIAVDAFANGKLPQ